MRKIWLTAVLLLAVLALTLPAAAQEPAPLRGWEKAGGYQYVRLGTYPYEKDGTKAPVLWRVLEVSDGQALLLSEQILDVQQVLFVDNQRDAEKTHDFRRLTDYTESDLHAWMNGEMLDTLLGDDPLLAAVAQTERGRLYPLTDLEYMRPEYGFSASRYGEVKQRYATATPYAKARKLYPDWGRTLYVDSGTKASPYWVAQVKAPTDIKMGIVGYNGHLSYGVYSRVNIGVRCALRLSTALIAVTGGQGTKDDPFSLAYTGSTAADETAPAQIPAAPLPESAEAAPEAAQEETIGTLIPEAAPEAAPEKAPEEARGENTVLLSFIGDCSIGDAYRSRNSELSLTAMIEQNGYDWPFSTVTPWLAHDDCTFANLEVVLTEKANLRKDIMYPLIGKPEFTEVLKAGSIEVVNTVNNHCMDYQATGYNDTLAALDAAGITNFGSTAWKNHPEWDVYPIVEVKGLKIGLVGFTYPQNGDLKNIAARIAALREQGAQLVVVSLHWGRETYLTPNSGQYGYAKKVIDSGADVVWGHHPHVLQPIYFYKGKPIMFSTGNFIFGTISDVDPYTGIFQLTYELDEAGNPVLKRLGTVALKARHKKGEYRPEVLTEQKEILTCRRRMYATKAVNGLTCIPAGFEDTGIVYIREDGSLSLTED